MKTYKDFSTRSEFIEYLGLYDKNTATNDFRTFDKIDPKNYVHELEAIVKNLAEIKHSWNNQSVNQIEKSVSTKGAKQLDIMQGQKKEKLDAGYHPDAPMYRIGVCAKDSFFYQYANYVGLEKPLARWHVQFPGEVTAWHTDIYSPAHEFLDPSTVDQSDESVGRDNGIRRIIIAIEDWTWGHMLMFGKTPWIDWKAGDVIYWEFGVPHGTANMGYIPRISVSITGKQTEKFLDITSRL
jgi:hypothetical protein